MIMTRCAPQRGCAPAPQSSCARSKLTDALLSGRLDDETFKRQQQRVRAERLVLVDKVNQTHEDLDDRYLLVARRIIELAKTARSRWKAGTTSEKRDLLDLLLSNPTMTGATVGYDLRKPFAVLVEMARHNEWRARRDSNPRPSGSKPDALSS